MSPAVPAYLKNVRVTYAPANTPGTLQNRDENDENCSTRPFAPKPARNRIPSSTMKDESTRHIMRRRRPEAATERKKRITRVSSLGTNLSSNSTSPPLVPLSPRTPTDSDTETPPTTSASTTAYTPIDSELETLPTTTGSTITKTLTDSELETLPSTTASTSAPIIDTCDATVSASDAIALAPISPSPIERVHVLTETELQQRIEAEVRTRLFRELTNKQSISREADSKRSSKRKRFNIYTPLRKSLASLSKSNVISEAPTESRRSSVDNERNYSDSDDISELAVESVVPARSRKRGRLSIVEVVNNLPKRTLVYPLVFAFVLTILAIIFGRLLEGPYSPRSIRGGVCRLLVVSNDATTRALPSNSQALEQCTTCTSNKRLLELPGPTSRIKEAQEHAVALKYKKARRRMAYSTGAEQQRRVSYSGSFMLDVICG